MSERSGAVDPRVAGLLVRVRRRLRAAWGLAWVQLLAPIASGVALLLVAGGWLLPWPWTDWAAAVVVAVTLLAVGVAALVVPVPLDAAARAADRGLDTKDALATSLEVPPDGEFGTRIHERARVASAGRPRDAVRLRVAGWRLAASGVLGVGAVALALVHSPQDEARERHAAERRAIEDVADGLAAEARTAGSSPSAVDDAVAAELEALSAALREADDLDDATELLTRVEEELAGEIGSDLLARKAATQGLERALGEEPLSAGEGRSAAEQLRDASAALANLDAEGRQALAERLEQLAGAQELGAPEVADALHAAADAVRAGDAQGAAEQLARAADGQAASSQAIDHQEAAVRAAARAGEAREALERAGQAATASAQADGQGDGQGQGEGQGQGQGQGQGEGQGEGQGQGQGQGEGQGQGQGEGQGQGQGEGQGQGQGRGGGGNPSGPVAGGGGSAGQGQGGTGRPVGGTGGAGDEPVDGAVFDPPSFREGDELNAGGGTGTGDGATVGVGDGPTTGGAARVPVADVIDRYARQATTAVDRAGIPPSVRDLVRDYFERLAGGG